MNLKGKRDVSKRDVCVNFTKHKDKVNDVKSYDERIIEKRKRNDRKIIRNSI